MESLVVKLVNADEVGSDKAIRITRDDEGKMTGAVSGPFPVDDPGRHDLRPLCACRLGIIVAQHAKLKWGHPESRVRATVKRLEAIGDSPVELERTIHQFAVSFEFALGLRRHGCLSSGLSNSVTTIWRCPGT